MKRKEKCKTKKKKMMKCIHSFEIIYSLILFIKKYPTCACHKIVYIQISTSHILPCIASCLLLLYRYEHFFMCITIRYPHLYAWRFDKKRKKKEEKNASKERCILFIIEVFLRIDRSNIEYVTVNKIPLWCQRLFQNTLLKRSECQRKYRD